MVEMDIELSLKSFAISLAREIAKDPIILQVIDEVSKAKGLDDDWRGLRESLSKPEGLARFVNNLEREAEEIEWTKLKLAAEKWAEYGWVIDDGLFKWELWEHIPRNQKEADTDALRYIKKKELAAIWHETVPVLLNHRQIFNEACICFNSKCYTACASLLVSLIDGTLISSKANNTQENRKTGSAAQKKVSAEILKDDFYHAPGYFYWHLVNFDAFISLLFARANNFSDEPPRINRNFLHHGMNKRKVLRKDCIKLFLAYKHALSYSK